MSGTRQNPLGLSDEDFLNTQPPSETGEASAQQETQENQENNQGENNSQTEAKETPTQQEQKPDNGEAPENQDDGTKEGVDGTAANAGAGADNQGAEGDKGEKAPDGASPGSGEADASKSGDKPAGKEGEKPASETEQVEAKAPNYEDFYKQVMAPFQANGKTIELKDPKEAIQLMQMGANYTRKLQEMAPHRKLLTMLQSNGVADESKLSFFIALDKKDPEAIKKLIKDSGIDPLDLDMNIEPAYREGSYQVTDEEVAFRTQLEDLTSTDTGKQTLQTINDGWDQASKDMLWQHPEVMSIIHAQRENGVYTKISDEMDRRKTLGQLSPTTPFLEAYKIIGDELHAAGAFGAQDGSEQGAKQDGEGNNQGNSAEKPAPAVVATRPAAPRPSVDNGDKAGAASPSRAAPGRATEVKNFLAMSDDDFLKANGLEGRV